MEGLNIQNTDLASNYLLNISIGDLEYKVSDFIFFGFVPRIENPLLNSRLRKSYLNYNTKYYSVGSIVYGSFPVNSLGLKLIHYFVFLKDVISLFVHCLENVCCHLCL